MSEFGRFMAPGPWLTRDLKECVLASDYDALAARLAEADALLRWCDEHWRSHVYEGAPSVHFLSRIDAFLAREQS